MPPFELEGLAAKLTLVGWDWVALVVVGSSSSSSHRSSSSSSSASVPIAVGLAEDELDRCFCAGVTCSAELVEGVALCVECDELCDECGETFELVVGLGPLYDCAFEFWAEERWRDLECIALLIMLSEAPKCAPSPTGPRSLPRSRL